MVVFLGMKEIMSKCIKPLLAFSQFFISISALVLSLIVGREEISRWLGLKELSAYASVAIHRMDKKVHLMISIENRGFATQFFHRLQSDKEIIQFLDGGHEDCYGVVMKPRSSKFLTIKEDRIGKIEKANSLFLANNMSQIKIASKKDIQKMLGLYKKYKKEGFKYSLPLRGSPSSWCNE